LPPYHSARTLEIVGLYKKRKFIGNSDHALDLQHSAGLGEISHCARDATSSIELNRSDFERSGSRQGGATFRIHELTIAAMPKDTVNSRLASTRAIRSGRSHGFTAFPDFVVTSLSSCPLSLISQQTRKPQPSLYPRTYGL
jgi:hypothetical protein